MLQIFNRLWPRALVKVVPPVDGGALQVLIEDAPALPPAKQEIDLAPFCSEVPARPYLHQPFTFGDFTYATDGIVAIRVQRRETIPERLLDECPAMQTSIERIFATLIAASDFAPMPAFEIVTDRPRKCTSCEGRGYLRPCHACDAHPDKGCQRCEGHRWVPCKKEAENAEACDFCDGTGKYRQRRAHFPSHDFQPDYIEKVQALPTLEVAFGGDPAKPLSFRFEGGCGLLMPLRRDA
jgi:hypothetical protein